MIDVAMVVCGPSLKLVSAPNTDSHSSAGGASHYDVPTRGVAVPPLHSRIQVADEDDMEEISSPYSASVDTIISDASPSKRRPVGGDARLKRYNKRVPNSRQSHSFYSTS